VGDADNIQEKEEAEDQGKLSSEGHLFPSDHDIPGHGFYDKEYDQV
jgi:hypothetical protein